MLAGKDKWRLGDRLPGAGTMRFCGLPIGSSAIADGHRWRTGRQCRAQPLPLSNSCGDRDRIGRRAIRVDPRYDRLRRCGLESSGSATAVVRLCVADRICVVDATQPYDGALWRQPRPSHAEAANGNRAVSVSDPYRLALCRLALKRKKSRESQAASCSTCPPPEDWTYA